MTVKVALLAGSLAAALVVAGAAAPSKPVPIVPGTVLHLSLPPGDPKSTRLVLEFRPAQGGTYTFEARSFDLDLAVRAAGAEDDNGGIAMNCRITFAVETGRRYPIEVTAPGDASGGALDAELSAGRPPALDPQEQRRQNLAYFDEAARRARERGRARRERKVNDAWTAALLNAGAIEPALPLLTRNVAIEEGIDPQSIETAGALVDLGIITNNSGRHAEGKSIAERAVALYERRLGPGAPEILQPLFTVAIALERLGDVEGARSTYERALELAERAGPSSDGMRAQLLTSFGVLHWNQGRFAEARPLVEQALAIDESILPPDHPELALACNNLAALLQSMGDYPGAQTQYERALAIDEKRFGFDHPNTLQVAGNLATILHDLNDYDAAIALQRRVLEAYERLHGPGCPEVAYTIVNLSTLLLEEGRPAEAVPLLERALAIAEERFPADDPDLARLLSNLGLARVNMGDNAAAIPYYRRAVTVLEKRLGTEAPLLALLLSNMGQAYGRLGDAAAARAAHDRAVRIAVAAYGPDHPEAASAFGMRAMTLAGTKETAAALDDALRAERILREHERLITRTLSEEQALQYETERVRGLSTALSILAAQRAPSPAQAAEVWNAVLRSRAIVLDEMAARRRSIAARGDAEAQGLAASFAEASERLAKLLVRGPSEEGPERYPAQVETARLERRRAEEALARRSATFRNAVGRENADLHAVSGGLPPETALVAYVAYRRERPPEAATTLAFAAFVRRAARSAPAFVDLGPAEPIRAAVARWRDELAHGAAQFGRTPAEAESACREAGRAVAALVWEPIAKRTGGARQVFVVPDGVLNLIPWAALPAGAGRGYLLEKGPAIQILTAERDLIPAIDAPPRGAGLLAVGGAAFDDRGVTAPSATRGAAPLAATGGTAPGCRDFQSLRFSPLPETAREVETLAALWREEPSGGEATLLQGSAAVEGTFKTRAAGHRVLHLATHGFFLGAECQAASGSPLRLAGLAFAGANRRDEAGPEEEDGVLTAEEVGGLNLSGVEWAVLSACDTGLGDIAASEGVVGLCRAFRTAGARSVIMSLWSVDDVSARRFMTALYEARLRDRRSTMDAMRSAALRIFAERRGRRESTHPYYWAGFIATGDWR